jgi:membrane protein required for colicin V production
LQPIDIILIGLLSWGAYKGYRRGLLVELINSVALMVAVWGGMALLDVGVGLLKPHLKGMAWLLPYLSFAIIFVGIIIGMRYLGRWLKQTIRYTLLGNIDDVAGAVVGMIKVMFALSTLLWIASLAGIKPPLQYTKGTFVYPVLAELGPKSVRLLSMFFPFMKQLAESLKHLLAKK